MPFLILIPVFLLLAVLMIFASMRRRDTETAVGQLSHKTRKRDQNEPAIIEPDDTPTTNREIEKAASIERRPPELEKVGASNLSAYVPPDADAVEITRHQFFNR